MLEKFIACEIVLYQFTLPLFKIKERFVIYEILIFKIALNNKIRLFAIQASAIRNDIEIFLNRSRIINWINWRSKTKVLICEMECSN